MAWLGLRRAFGSYLLCEARVSGAIALGAQMRLQQQILFENDRKKSKGKDQGKDRSRSFAALRMTNLFKFGR